MTATEQIILVDNNDNPIGTGEKFEVHSKGLCHRAFSIFIFNNQRQLLLQQRAKEKYHSPNLWTNTCCSHPRPDETILTAAQRRLKEEMRIDTPLKVIDKFHYIAYFENGLIENEIDYVIIGEYSPRDNTVNINQKEVQAYQWLTLEDLAQEMKNNPKNFTPWLQKGLDIIRETLQP